MEKYHLIYQELKKRILDGKYALGYRFPIEPELAAEFGVARVTLRKAMRLLAQDNLIERLPRQGTFIKSMTLHSPKRILVIVKEFSGDVSSPSYSILPGVEAACREYNLELICASAEQIRCQQCQLDHENFIGIILLDEYLERPIERQFVLDSKLPAVWAHDTRDDQSATLDFATISRRNDAIFLVLDHLMGLGHRKILTLANRFNTTMRSVSFDDYLNYIRAHGGDADPHLLIPVKLNDMNDITASLNAMFTPNPPTAIVCYSDFLAMRVYNVLKKHNILIPGDVAVTGFGGYSGSQLFDPPLTTIDQHYLLRGKLAVKMLLEARNWFPEQRPCFQLLSALTIRESSNKIIYHT